MRGSGTAGRRGGFSLGRCPARISAYAQHCSRSGGRLLAAAAGLSLVTGILFGIFPALQLSKPDLTNALKDGSRGSTGAGRQRMRSALVVAEVALAVVLLVGAALFIGSFITLMRINRPQLSLRGGRSASSIFMAAMWLC